MVTYFQSFHVGTNSIRRLHLGTQDTAWEPPACITPELQQVMQADAIAEYEKVHTARLLGPQDNKMAATHATELPQFDTFVYTPPKTRSRGLQAAAGVEVTPQSPQWVSRLSRQGYVYYWNKYTQQTQWDHPISGAVDPNVKHLRSQGRLDLAGAFTGAQVQPKRTTSEITRPESHAIVEPTPTSKNLAHVASQVPLAGSLALASARPSKQSHLDAQDFLKADPPPTLVPTCDTQSNLASPLPTIPFAAAGSESCSRSPGLVVNQNASGLPPTQRTHNQLTELAETILELQSRHKIESDEWTERFLKKQEEVSDLKEKYSTEKMQMLQELSELKQKAITDYFRGQQDAAQKQNEDETTKLQLLADKHSSSMETQRKIYDSSLRTLQDQNTALEKQLEALHNTLIHMQSAHQQESAQLSNVSKETDEQRAPATAKTEDSLLKEAFTALKLSHAAEIQDLRQQLFQANQTLEERVLEAVAFEEHKCRQELQKHRDSVASQIREVRGMEQAKSHAELAALTAERDAARAMYQRELRERRKLANELIDLKGNIRVLARIRPVQGSEIGSGQEEEVVTLNQVEPGEIQIEDRRRRHTFRFDSAFGPESTQKDVFAVIKPLSDTVLDGYNVCIFAYGQTGSGKTYTMQGIPSEPGVSKRALSSIFRTIDERKQFGSISEAALEVSVLEVYNESIRDLLATSAGAASSRALELQRDRAGAMQVLGLSRSGVQSVSEVLKVIDDAILSRATGSTDANAHSSRSHLVITLYCSCRHASGTKTLSKLHLIDLAGSERVGKTSASGDRLKEAQHINKSLLALGDVIDSLGTKRKAHIPYRNSKLTHFLSDSLSGGSKVLMVVNTSPALFNSSESVCSLRFAERCRSTELGQASRAMEK